MAVCNNCGTSDVFFMYTKYSKICPACGMTHPKRDLSEKRNKQPRAPRKQKKK